MRGLRPAEWQLALPLALAYAAFFLVPLLLLIAVSAFDDETLTTAGFAQWRKFLADPFTWKVIVDTIKLGGLTVAATALIGYPVALVYLGASAGWQRVILFVVILPLLTSVVVRTFAWIVILGREGVINQTVLWLGLVPAPLRLLQTEHGLVLALTQIEMPLLLLPLLSVMSRLDPNLRDASAGLGASKWRTLFRITLPLSLHLAVRHRRKPARLPAPADLAAVAGRLQLAAGVRGGADPARVRRRGGGRHCRPGPARARGGLLACERSERATSATRPSSASWPDSAF